MTENQIKALLAGFISLPLVWVCNAAVESNTVGVTEAPVRTECPEGQLRIGEFHLGMSVDDAFALLQSRHPETKPRLYPDGQVLCVADASGQDLCWADAKTRRVHWITLTPTIVRRIVGFGTGTFADLKCAVERKLSVSFGLDSISKGDVSQEIGNLETVDGETLRYFISSPDMGEDPIRSARKAINRHEIDFDLGNGGLGAAFANAFEDAIQSDENARNAQSPRFAPRGSLQLQWTRNAVKGDIGASGRMRRSKPARTAFGPAPFDFGFEDALDDLDDFSF